MAISLNKRALSHAKDLVRKGKVVRDERDDWSEHAPSTADENAFIKKNDYSEYSKWHLGVDDSKPEDTKAHFSFPYGDFRSVHRCAVISAESRAGQYNHADIEGALKQLLSGIDGT